MNVATLLNTGAPFKALFWGDQKILSRHLNSRLLKDEVAELGCVLPSRVNFLLGAPTAPLLHHPTGEVQQAGRLRSQLLPSAKTVLETLDRLNILLVHELSVTSADRLTHLLQLCRLARTR